MFSVATGYLPSVLEPCLASLRESHFIGEVWIGVHRKDLASMSELEEIYRIRFIAVDAIIELYPSHHIFVTRHAVFR